MKKIKCSYVTLKDTTLPPRTMVTQKIRDADKKQFLPFVNKKVTVTEERESLLGKRTLEQKGRIKQIDSKILFIEKGRRTKAKEVTAGLFDGFYATMTIKKIKPCW